MKRNNYSHKMRCEESMKLIYIFLLNDMYTELTHMKIQYKKITYVYEKTHVTVM